MTANFEAIVYEGGSLAGHLGPAKTSGNPKANRTAERWRFGTPYSCINRTHLREEARMV